MVYDCLIIDDEKLLADSTAEYFNLFGVKTAVAYCAYDCRKFFRENAAQLLCWISILQTAAVLRYAKNCAKQRKDPFCSSLREPAMTTKSSP